jgi:hypothetical protein
MKPTIRVMIERFSRPMLKPAALAALSGVASLAFAGGCGKVDTTPPSVPSATASIPATATATAPTEKRYSFDLKPGFELGNSRNVVFAFGARHGPFAAMRTSVEAATCQADYDPDTPPDLDRKILEAKLVGLPSEQAAIVAELVVTMAAEPSSPVLLFDGACYGVRGRDGRWTWHVREQKMVYNAGSQTYTARFTIREPGPIDAVKLLTFANNAMHITNITYTVAVAP